MKKEEEMKLLREQNRSYLWNKPRNQWTELDIENLRNGIGIQKKTFQSQDTKPKRRMGRSFKQPVMVISAIGIEQEYISAVEASKATGVLLSTVYSRINGSSENTEDYQFFKSKINK
jgi:hypothetical protein